MKKKKDHALEEKNHQLEEIIKQRDAQIKELQVKVIGKLMYFIDFIIVFIITLNKYLFRFFL